MLHSSIDDLFYVLGLPPSPGEYGEVNHTWGVIAVTAIQLLQSGLMTRALKERCQNTMQCLKRKTRRINRDFFKKPIVVRLGGYHWLVES